MKRRNRGSWLISYLGVAAAFLLAAACGEKDPADEQVASPVFSPPAGTYEEPIDVEISTGTEGATIFYTMDGSEPSATNGQAYDGPIALAGDGLEVTIKALAFKEDMLDSEVVEASYTLEYPVEEEKVATPSFSPPAGTYNEPISVEISTETQGAAIFYTIDGSEPSADSGEEYDSPVDISDGLELTIRALAVKEGMLDSDVAEAAYAVEIELEQVAAPVFSPPPGTYHEDMTVEISTATTGASIYYTMDGSDPTAADGEEYDSPIELEGDGLAVTIKAIAVKDEMADSEVAEADYVIEYLETVEKPTFSPAAGTYYEPIDVEISTATDGASIYYTTDGSVPSADGGEEYDGPITLEQNGLELTIKAIAVKDGMYDSDIAEAVYLVDFETVAAPVFTPAPGTYHDPVDVEITTATDGAVIYFTTDGSEPSVENGTEYVGPITLDEYGLQVTIKALASKDGMYDSNVVQGVYLVDHETVAAPTFTPGSGTYFEPINVEIETATEGATIYFTLDDSEPSADNGDEYVDAIALEDDGLEVTIKAIALNHGMHDSDVVSAGYIMNFTPDTPSVVYPTQGSTVRSPLDVWGTGVAGNTIEATLLHDDDEISQETVDIEPDGSFELTLHYTDVEGGADLRLNVVQIAGDYVSEPAVINLVEDSMRFLAGTIEQTGGPNEGDVYIWLYEAEETGSTVVEDLLEPMNTFAIVGPEHDWLDETSFAFSVTEGHYVLRVFRDAGGGDGGTPDGLPSIGDDAQSVVLAVSVSGEDVTDLDLELVDTSHAHRYAALEVFSSNETSEPEPPYYEDNGDWLRGEGLCRGYHMRLETHLWHGDESLSEPRVRRPDGSMVTMLDDGACGPEVADNTSSSYNHWLDDGFYSFGWQDPDDSDAGVYTFFYENSAEGFFHIEERELGEVVKLTRSIPLTSPSGAEPNTDLQPELSWESLGGDVSYHVCLQKSHQWDWSICESTDEAFIQLPFEDDLDDVQAYCADVSATKSCPLGHRIAQSAGVRSCFVTCTDPQNDCVTISGDIIDRSGMESRYLIEAFSDQYDDIQSTLVLPAGTESYQLAVLKHEPDDDDVEVIAALDVDGSGDFRSRANEDHEIFVWVEADEDRHGVDLVFNPMVRVIYPLDGEGEVGDQPTFEWEAYEQTYLEQAGEALPLAEWMYLLLVTRDNGGMGPDVVWALDESVTSFDMTDPPADGFDLRPLSPMDGPSAEDLSESNEWFWEVAVFDCHYEDEECLEEMMGTFSFFAISAEAAFTTD